MEKEIKFPGPTRLPPIDADEVEGFVKAQALLTGNVLILKDVYASLDKRTAESVLPTQTIYKVLQEGRSLGDPTRNSDGGWSLTMALRMPGGPRAGFVTLAVSAKGGLIVRSAARKDIEQ